MSNCLSCKACTTECPSNVNLALLKAELLHARIRRDGLTLRERMFSSVDLLGKLGCFAPRSPMPAFKWPWLRRIDGENLRHRRATPVAAVCRGYGSITGSRNTRIPGRLTRGRVMLWDDTFVRYHEPNIGIAAVTVLEAAGFEVALPQNRANAADGPPSARAISMKPRSWAATISHCWTG